VSAWCVYAVNARADAGNRRIFHPNRSFFEAACIQIRYRAVGPDMQTHNPAPTRRLRARLVERVADADDSHLTLAPDGEPGAAPWQPFLPGVAIKPLLESGGILSYLLRLDPGASLPAHRHPEDEECLVLEGRLRVGSRVEIGAGGYHLARQGSLHARLHTDTGATIFLRGAVPDADQANF
jgi:ChrR Cupin-like domain